MRLIECQATDLYSGPRRREADRGQAGGDHASPHRPSWRPNRQSSSQPRRARAERSRAAPTHTCASIRGIRRLDFRGGWLAHRRRARRPQGNGGSERGPRSGGARQPARIPDPVARLWRGRGGLCAHEPDLRPRGCKSRYRELGTARGHLATLHPRSTRHAAPCGARQYNLVAALWSGTHLTVLRRFRSQTFWEQVRQSRATKFWCIGTMPAMLMNTPPGATDGDHNLTAVWCVGIPRPLHGALEERFQVRWLEAFGTSETGVNLFQALDSPSAPGEGWLGDPVPYTEGRLVGQEGKVVDGDGEAYL